MCERLRASFSIKNPSFAAQGFPGVVPDVITFNVGIAAYMAQRLDDRAFELLDEMERRGVRPRADTFNSILTGLTKASASSLWIPQTAIGIGAGGRMVLFFFLDLSSD